MGEVWAPQVSLVSKCVCLANSRTPTRGVECGELYQQPQSRCCNGSAACVRALRMRRSQLYPVSRAARAPAGQLLGWSAQCCLVLTDRQTTHVERLHLTRCSRTQISQTTPGVLVRLPAQHFSSNRYVTTVSHCFFDY